MKKNILFGLIGAVVAILCFTFYNHQATSTVQAIDLLPMAAQAEEKPQPHTIKTYPIALPSHLDFCGESVPMGDRDAQERLDRELLVNTYWQSQTLLILKEYNKLRPLMEPVLKEYKIPTDFIFLAAAESGFKNVVSPANAVGVWQMLGETARHNGLEVNDEVDERYHFVKSTEAACKYLLDAYNQFGSWTMAAASYNMGMAGLRKTRDQQLAKTYYDMMLSSETQRYVFRILAFKEILNHPERYGFMITENDLYQPYRFEEVKVDTVVPSWARFAQKYNLSYKELKILNPWMRSYKLTNKQAKDYVVYVMQKNNQ